LKRAPVLVLLTGEDAEEEEEDDDDDNNVNEIGTQGS
jgi:hypothetical protein